jgi:hypothetical protein
MLNKIPFLVLIIALFPLFAVAQTTDDGTKTLGTIIQSQIDEPDADAIADDAVTDDIIMDPDFLNDDGQSYDSYNKVIIRILDKVTAESRTFDLNIGKTVAFGSLRIQPKTCKKAPPIDEPESASFLQIWEKTPEMKDEWVFSGWMFASSPALSAMEHPVYDVWVIDCKD